MIASTLTHHALAGSADGNCDGRHELHGGRSIGAGHDARGVAQAAQQQGRLVRFLEGRPQGLGLAADRYLEAARIEQVHHCRPAGAVGFLDVRDLVGMGAGDRGQARPGEVGGLTGGAQQVASAQRMNVGDVHGLELQFSGLYLQAPDPSRCGDPRRLHE